jgi:glyoxylase-like metal-dependent hydrolase (beta-lactamase superfamily II)
VRQSAIYRTNGLVLRGEGGVLLVDPGVLPGELEDIAAFVADFGEPALFFSHSHWDHVLGRLFWPDARLVAHRSFHETLKRELPAVRRRVAELSDEFYLAWPGVVDAWAPDERVGEQHEWMWHGRRYMALHAAGHAPDQVVLHVPGDRLLFAADMLSDLEIPFLGGACEEYLDSLARVRALVESGAVDTLVPGHGVPARGLAEIERRLDRDGAYLAELHRRVLAARARRVPLEDLIEQSAEMDHVGKKGWPPMERAHRENVERAYRALMQQ